MLEPLNSAYTRMKASGRIKLLPEDFCVEENLGFELSGEGEHLCLLIEKKQLNTEEMAKIIAKELHLPFKAVSYAGLKDKYAITTQWFSVHLPGLSDPELAWLNTDNYRLLKAMRHHKKLKIGALKSNHFRIKIHDFEYDSSELTARIQQVKAQGVPNYFGPQRFGNHGSNLEKARTLLLENKKVKNHHLRGIYYSAARAFLFNQILSLRVQNGCWNRSIKGDLMMLSGTNSVFQVDTIDDDIVRRVSEHDIFPAAALWGEGHERLVDEALHSQTTALNPWKEWCTALEQHRLRKSYRSMILLPEQLEFKENRFEFTLPKGTFATTVLGELLSYD